MNEFDERTQHAGSNGIESYAAAEVRFTKREKYLDPFVGSFPGKGVPAMPISVTLALLLLPGAGGLPPGAVARLGSAFRPSDAHNGPITALAWSPDGTMLATGSEDGDVLLWDRDGRLLRRLEGHQDFVLKVVFAPGGRTVVAIGWDGFLRQWDVATGKPLQVSHIPKSFFVSVIFTPDGNSLITGDTKGVVRTWNCATGQQRKARKIGDGITYAALSPDGRLLVTFDNSIRSKIGVLTAWPVEGDQPRFQVETDVSAEERQKRFCDYYHFLFAAFSADGHWLLTIESSWKDLGQRIDYLHDRAPLVRIWESATGREVCRIEPRRLIRLDTLALSQDGRFLVVDADSGLFLWDVAGSCEVKGHGIPSAAHATFSPDGQFLAALAADGTARIWDTRCWPRRVPFTPRVSTGQSRRNWADLATDDAAQAFDVMQTLTVTPRESVTFLKQRLRPIARADAGHVARLIADLNDERFAVRQRAALQLEEWGEQVLPALKTALKSAKSPEERQQIGRLIERAEQHELTAAGRRASRCVAALERLGTAEARSLLTELAQGVPEATLTRHSRDALRRLKQRPLAEE